MVEAGKDLIEKVGYKKTGDKKVQKNKVRGSKMRIFELVLIQMKK